MLYLFISVYICLYLVISGYIWLYLVIAGYICLYPVISGYICRTGGSVGGSAGGVTDQFPDGFQAKSDLTDSDPHLGILAVPGL